MNLGDPLVSSKPNIRYLILQKKDDKPSAESVMETSGVVHMAVKDKQ